jgi:hypothetical protein
MAMRPSGKKWNIRRINNWSGALESPRHQSRGSPGGSLNSKGISSSMALFLLKDLKARLMDRID